MFRKNYFNLAVIVSLFLLASVFTGTLFSQPVPKNRPDPKMKEEIKTYVKSNVMPELSIWKTKLDKAMSKEDLATLDKVRAKAKELKKIK